MSPWTAPEAHVQAQLARVYEIYTEHYEELQVAIRDRLTVHPELGPIIKDYPRDREAEQRTHRLAGDALVRGDWRHYLEQVSSDAGAYAQMRLSLNSWVELISRFRLDMVAKVFASDIQDRDELHHTLAAVHEWLDGILAVSGQVFVSASEQTIAAQQQAIRSLSTPVLQVRPGLLILPMIGALDRERLDQLRVALLDQIRERRSRVVVIDVTGVPEIDSVAANQLIGSVTSARLMGAEVIISGLSAEIAQTLVTIGIDLSRVISAGDLQSGIEIAESLLGSGSPDG